MSLIAGVVEFGTLFPINIRLEGSPVLDITLITIGSMVAAMAAPVRVASDRRDSFMVYTIRTYTARKKNIANGSEENLLATQKKKRQLMEKKDEDRNE